jgi:hypothetical protein
LASLAPDLRREGVSILKEVAQEDKGRGEKRQEEEENERREMAGNETGGRG